MRPTGLAVVHPGPLPQPQSGLQGRVGVVVNASSRQVNERLMRLLPEVVPGSDLYVTHLAADAALIARRVLERRYDTLFVGGGDRTFSTLCSALLRQAGLCSLPVPRLGLLRLGTTQGLATLVSASGRGGKVGLLDDVLRARSGEIPGYRSLDLLELEGAHALCAGLGLEALGALSLGGLRSLGRQVELEARVGEGGSAQRISPDGQPLGEPLAAGELLFRGKVGIAAAGTAPYVGTGEAVFPHAASRAGFMHLRLGTRRGSLVTLFPGRGEELYDFLTTSVNLSFGRAVPVALGPAGVERRDALSLRVLPQAVELADFSHALH